jgi:aryl-alcohol dehydrogenase-like predicted oxidoreductase
MQYRELGRTGSRVSVIGMGGIVVSGMSQDEASRTVRSAIDRGVTYFDFSPTYGNSEELLGPAIEGKRDKLFLACKTTKRDRAGAKEELERSLKRLRTDHFDLYQLHGVPNLKDLRQALGPDGAMEAISDAKSRGQVRHVGITTHQTEVALEGLKSFDFDSVLFPVNFVCWLRADVGPEVLEAAAKKGAGRLAIKSMALRPWPEGANHKWNKAWYQPIDDPALARLAVRFTLTRDVAAMLPPGHLELWEMAMSAADDGRPLEPDEMVELSRVAAAHEPVMKKVG